MYKLYSKTNYSEYFNVGVTIESLLRPILSGDTSATKRAKTSRVGTPCLHKILTFVLRWLLSRKVRPSFWIQNLKTRNCKTFSIALYILNIPYPWLLLPVCTVHYIWAPVTSATPHVWNQNLPVVQIMFISSREIEHSFSNKARHLVYQRPCRCTKQQLCNTRSVPYSFLIHSSAHSPPHFSLLSQLSK